MRRKQKTIPAFFEVLDKGQLVFVPSAECLSNPGFHKKVVDRALAELGEWRDRYGTIIELLAHKEGQAIVGQIDRLKGKLGVDWPMLPDRLQD